MLTFYLEIVQCICSINHNYCARLFIYFLNYFLLVSSHKTWNKLHFQFCKVLFVLITMVPNRYATTWICKTYRFCYFFDV